MFNETIIANSSKTQGQLLTAAQRKHLQELQKSNLREEYRRRIEIMLLADQGHSQSQICRILKCSYETARYWYYIAYTGQTQLWNTLPIGRPKTVNDQYIERLKELVTSSPRNLGYSFQRWTAQWLSKHLAKEFNIEVSTRHINRLLKEMGISTRYKSSRNKPKTQERCDKSSSGISICDIPIGMQPKLPKLASFSINSVQESSRTLSETIFELESYLHDSPAIAL